MTRHFIKHRIGEGRTTMCGKTFPADSKEITAAKSLVSCRHCKQKLGLS